jgi:hypothetical protein
VTRGFAVLAALLLACAGGAGAASAESGELVDFSLSLKNPAPASPTGLILHVKARGEEKPSPVRTVVYEAPPGTRFDTGTLTECMASDEEIEVLGTEACPPESLLTIGSLTSISGFGPPLDPFEADVHVFNGPSQLIEVIAFQGTTRAAAIDRVTIEGSTLTAHPPKAPGGPPDGEMAVKSIDYEVPAQVSGDRSLITTPPACPASGAWASIGFFDFADESSDTVASTMPCSATAQPGDLSLMIKPRRVPVGERVRLRFRVRSATSSCVSGATIRVAGRELETGPRGRARLVTTFRRERKVRARATSPGCGRAKASFRVE